MSAGAEGQNKTGELGHPELDSELDSESDSESDSEPDPGSDSDHAGGQGRLSATATLVGSGLILLIVVKVSPLIVVGDEAGGGLELLREPRTLLAALVGATLAACGVVLQSVLRNELASPFTLGVASGATLGAAVAVRFDLGFALMGIAILDVRTLLALLGALGSTGLILLVSRRTGSSSESLVLAGVGISLLVNAVVVALFVGTASRRYSELIFWTMGNLQIVGDGMLRLLLPPLLIGAGGILWIASDLNVIALDEDSARALGVVPSRIRRLALLATGIATAGVVAVAGPIGFVGLIVPHAVRRISGPDTRVVLPASAMIGGAFLVLCDLLARTVLAPEELPIGVVTALIGSPIFLLILLRHR